MWLDQMGGNDSFFPADFQQILLGGDALTPAFARRVLTDAIASPNVQVKNVYGPTEGTVFSSYGVLSHKDIKSISRRCRVPIDRLMPHVKMTVSGPTGSSLPRGFVGEIIIWVRPCYLGAETEILTSKQGDCLTLGYANLPQLNAERFLTRNGLRGWRSGDLGRQLPCGRFEILGRIDSMCKVRGGFRVELSEIEGQIASFEQVADCHVSATVIPGAVEKQVVAHVVFQRNPNEDAQAVAEWKQVGYCSFARSLV
jgi:non-ribosomal peptide synthetase component F